MWPDRTPHPTIWEVRQLQQPFAFKLLETSTSGSLHLEVCNENLFTDLSLFGFSYEIKNEFGVLYIGKLNIPSVAPGTAEQFTVQLCEENSRQQKVDAWLNITAVVDSKVPWAPVGLIMGGCQLAVKVYEPDAASSTRQFAISAATSCRLSPSPLDVQEKQGLLVASFDNSVIEFCTKTGLMTSWIVDGLPLLAEEAIASSAGPHGPLPCFFRAPTDNDIGGIDQQLGMFPDWFFDLSKHLVPVNEKSLAERWRKAGLADLRVLLERFSWERRPDAGGLFVTTVLHFVPDQAAHKVIFKATVEYIIADSKTDFGDVIMSVNVEADPKLPPLPRIGVSMVLPPKFRQVRA